MKTAPNLWCWVKALDELQKFGHRELFQEGEFPRRLWEFN